MSKLQTKRPDERPANTVSSLLLQIVENALPISDDPILTVEQVTADLSVSRRTLFDWMHKGDHRATAEAWLAPLTIHQFRQTDQRPGNPHSACRQV